MSIIGGQRLTTADWSANYVKKTITFAGGTANAIGDHDGTGDPFTIFTVTGNVLVRVLAICTTNLAGNATLEVGITGDTAEILAQVADAEAIDAGEIWHDATVDSGCKTSSVLAQKIIANGADIIGTVGTANITAGVIDFYCYWQPLSEGSSVVAA